MPQRLADNILHFARVLRAAGLPVGTDRALCAVQAVEALGVARRDDLHAALSAVMLDSHEQQLVFDAAFAAFWRDPKLLERLMYLMLPKVSGRGTREDEAQRPRRVDEALSPQRAAVPPKPPTPNDDDEEQTFDAIMTHSERERLQVTDFESMSADEFARARRLAESIELPLRPITSRRRVSASRGQIDLRASLRTMARNPDAPRPAYDHRKRLRPPLVILIDISGSMERYSRAFLHFAHGLSRRHRGTHTFVFGTRLTDISRCLRHRDPDQALALAGRAAQDWRGGTRIASSLDDFNRHWARRVLTGNASLLLVTDGLDRDDAGELGLAAAELARWAREIIWLNPLLRYDGFEPKAAGIRALLPHAKAMIPVHDLRSLADIAQAVERQRSATIRKTRRAR
ncbi:MAG TPA: VWA domain-containing protein [Burkholderiaceae bacterium]|nr:VWA domain-containing protein [Burkholderiaceae bacterium]